MSIPAQELTKARKLIELLGNEEYAERENASAELAKMGRLALPVLLQGVLHNPDQEVRLRCSRLIPKAEANDLKARLDTFRADAGGKYKHDLPGLKQFREHIGTDNAARDLFIEIIKNPRNLALLRTLDKTPTEVGRAIADRQRALLLYQDERRKPPERVDIACLVFAESLVPPKKIPPLFTGWDWKWSIIWVRELNLSSSIESSEETSRRDVVNKRIVFSWMESRGLRSLDQIPLPFPTGK